MERRSSKHFPAAKRYGDVIGGNYVGDDIEGRADGLSLAVGAPCGVVNEFQPPTSKQAITYWSSFVATAALAIAFVLWWVYSPGQDHMASISLDGGGAWYQNYEMGFELQDHEIFFHGIGHSIENARRADIILLGSSKIIFGTDWRVMEEFEGKHHVRLFNMGFAGGISGEFPLLLIRKWGLHPKLWIINSDLDESNITRSFFYMQLPGGGNFRNGSPKHVVTTSRLGAFLTVVGRNVRWRLKMAVGILKHDAYRSARDGNWYLNNWPQETLTNYPKIDMSGRPCLENREETNLARQYREAIGGAVVLVQVPSVVACSQRIEHLASALGVPSFTVAPEDYSTFDSGWHLDRKSARLYTMRLFEWLERQPEFRHLVVDDGAPSN